MNDWLLEILKCPISGEKLQIAGSDLVASLQAKQQSAALFSHKGIQLDEPFEGGLTNQSATYFYCISDDIPSLLPDEAVSIAREA